MKIAGKDFFGWPGQNTHEEGMGKELANAEAEAAAIYKTADAITLKLLGIKISDISFNGSKEVLEEHSQLAILVLGAAIVAVLYRKGKIPRRVGGHSFGEWGALLGAGAFSEEETPVGPDMIHEGLTRAIPLVHERQLATGAANADVPGGGGMIALSGLEDSQIAYLAKNHDVDVAAINTDTQSVLSGPNARIREVQTVADQTEGVRPTILDINGPYHSRWFAGVGRRMAEVLEGVEFHRLKIPFLAGNAKSISDLAALKKHMVDMFTQPVLFRDLTREMARLGDVRFVEIGNHLVLGKFVGRVLGKEFPVEVAGKSLKEVQKES